MASPRLHARVTPATISAWKRCQRLARAVAVAQEGRLPKAEGVLAPIIVRLERDLRERADAAGLDVAVVLGEREAAAPQLPVRPLIKRLSID